MANNQATDTLSAIGAMQTMIANFPMGIATSHNVKSYSSSLDFLLDALKTIGVTETEIIQMFLKWFGVNDLNVVVENYDEQFFQDNKFITTLERVLKIAIAEILSEIVSCSIWPLIPETASTIGFTFPVTLLDSNKIFETCPVTDNGKRLYGGINSATTISSLSAATDLNAAMWYCLNMGNMIGVTDDYIEWKDQIRGDGKTIMTLQNWGTQQINVKIGNFKSLKAFNWRYLDNIKILSPKVLLFNILSEFAYGTPFFDMSIGFTDVYNEAQWEKMIMTIVSNNDLGVEDCYYTFSNDDWYNLMEETELRKFHAKKAGDKSNTAVPIDQDAVINAMNSASSASTLAERTDIIEGAMTDIASTTVESTAVTSEGTITRRAFDIDFNINSEWIYNLLSKIITPIMRSVLTPKVMMLIVINYRLAGAINPADLEKAQLGIVLEGARRKLMGIIASLTKIVWDWILDRILKFFNEKIQPTLNLYAAIKLQEELENWLMVLNQALECVMLFGWPNNGTTAIDDVRGAEIEELPIKNNPQQNNC